MDNEWLDFKDEDGCCGDSDFRATETKCFDAEFDWIGTVVIACVGWLLIFAIVTLFL